MSEQDRYYERASPSNNVPAVYERDTHSCPAHIVPQCSILEQTEEMYYAY